MISRRDNPGVRERKPLPSKLFRTIPIGADRDLRVFTITGPRESSIAIRFYARDDFDGTMIPVGSPLIVFEKHLEALGEAIDDAAAEIEAQAEAAPIL